MALRHGSRIGWRERTIIVGALLLAWVFAGIPAVADDGAMEAVHLWLEARDAGGELARGLTVDDLRIVEGGDDIPAERIELRTPRQRAAGRPARVAIYFDPRLGRTGTLRTSADALAALAEELSELGEVEIVIAEGIPSSELSTRQVAVIKGRLQTATGQLDGESTILEIRGELFEELERIAPGSRRADPGVATAALARAIEAEYDLLRQRFDELMIWAGEESTDRPRVLFWVQDGFDLDPLAFYREHLLGDVVQNLATDPAFQSAAEETALALAGSGWTVIPVAIRPDAEPRRGVEPTAILLEDPMGPGSGNEPPPGGIGFKIRPRRLSWFKKDRDAEGPPTPALAGPSEGLELFAEASGGTLAQKREALDAAVGALLERYELIYRAGGGGLRSLAITPLDPGLELRAQRWVSRTTPEAITAARLRRLLAGDEPVADLELDALLRLNSADESLPTSAELELLLYLQDLGPGGSVERPQLGEVDLAFTLGAVLPDGELWLARWTRQDKDLSGFSRWHQRLTVELPENVRDLALTVEMLGLDLWAGARVEGVVLESEDRDRNLLEAARIDDGG